MSETELPKFKLSPSIFREIWQNSRRVMRIVLFEQPRLITSLVLVLVASSAMPSVITGMRGLLINALVKDFGTGAISAEALMGLILMLVAAAALPLFGILEGYLSKQSWFFFNEKFETLLTEKKGELDIAIHENPKYNNLFSTVKENGWWRLQNFADRQFYIFQNILEITISLFILSFANWWLALILLAGAFPELLTEIRYGRQVWNIHTSNAERKRKFWALSEHFDRLGSLIELRLFQNTKHFVSLIHELFFAFRKEERINERKKLIHQFSTALLTQAVIIFAIVWFVFDVVHGRLQIGTLTFLLASIGNLRQSLSGLFLNLGRQYQDNLFVTDVFKLIDLKPVINRPAQGVVLPVGKTPSIIFDNVSFRYPGATANALTNFSFTIMPGEKLAIIGANGAGKTTIVKLLCRFYDATEGRILIDGYDLREINLDSWYDKIGAIFQDYSQYHMIVKDVIALGKGGGGTDILKVRAAAKAAEADIFIEEFEKNYEQQLGKQFTGGVEPSIGQWQKLALARTFYRDPQVLILDEPTSSIDAEAEAKIFDRLEQLPKDRTVILISHRFSTVRHADKICVIEGGKMTEQGTHDELLKQDGTYARLFKLQAKGYR